MKKLKPGLLVLILMTATLLLCGCPEGDSILFEADGDLHDGRVYAIVHGTVLANDTQTPLQDVEVIYSVDGETVSILTDSNGYYESVLLGEGNYVFTFNAPDQEYASWQQVFNVVYAAAQQVPSDEDFIQSIAGNVNLFRTNSSVRGYVYAEVDDEETILAAGAIVKLVNLGGILNQDYSDTTDQDGLYQFDSVPAVPGAQLMVLPWTGNEISFAANVINVQLIEGATVTADPIVLQPNQGDMLVLSNNFANGDIPVDQDLQIIFSRPIQETSLICTLTRLGTGITISMVTTLDETNLQLTLQPIIPLQLGTNYRLEVEGISTDYQDFNFDWAFNTQDGIELESHNLETADGVPREFELTEAAEFTFTEAIDPNNPNNFVTMSRNATDILVDWSLDNDDKTLIIEPVGSYLYNTEYTVVFLVFSTLPNDSYTTVGNQFTFETIQNQDAPSQVTSLMLNADLIPNGVNWNSVNIPLMWDAQSDIDLYQIYASNDFGVTDRILIDEVLPTQVVGTQLHVADLSVRPEFDWITGDGIQTPFTYSIETVFYVRAVNAGNNGEFSDPLTVSDTRAPEIPGLNQDNSVLNLSPTDELVVTITFSADMEYCSSNTPTFEFIEDGGDPGYVLPNSALEWTWDPDFRNGTLVITVPPNTDGRSDLLIVTDVEDSSGNAATEFVHTLW